MNKYTDIQRNLFGYNPQNTDIDNIQIKEGINYISLLKKMNILKNKINDNDDIINESINKITINSEKSNKDKLIEFNSQEIENIEFDEELDKEIINATIYLDTIKRIKDVRSKLKELNMIENERKEIEIKITKDADIPLKRVKISN